MYLDSGGIREEESNAHMCVYVSLSLSLLVGVRVGKEQTLKLGKIRFGVGDKI